MGVWTVKGGGESLVALDGQRFCQAACYLQRHVSRVRPIQPTLSFNGFSSNSNFQPSPALNSAPGFFVSRMTAYGYEHNREVFENNQPTGRVGNIEDMAGLALFLCSRASAHMTGDGGFLFVHGAVDPFMVLMIRSLTVIAIDGGASLTGGTKLPMNFAQKIAENKARL